MFIIITQSLLTKRNLWYLLWKFITPKLNQAQKKFLIESWDYNINNGRREPSTYSGRAEKIAGLHRSCAQGLQLEAQYAHGIFSGPEGRQGHPRSLIGQGGPGHPQGCQSSCYRIHIWHEHRCQQGGRDHRVIKSQLQQGAVAGLFRGAWEDTT